MTVNYSMIDKSESDENSWHDCLFDLSTELGVDFKHFNLAKCFDMLPQGIQLIAVQWSLSDSVFRDEAHTWLLENYKPE